MAEGGIVTKPTLALLGEAGKNEAVIPLPKGGLGLEGLMGGTSNKRLDVYGKIANRDLALTNRRSSKYN
jgi:SLT domain-containing protein